jgi:hypothetical protein
MNVDINSNLYASVLSSSIELGNSRFRTPEMTKKKNKIQR